MAYRSSKEDVDLGRRHAKRRGSVLYSYGCVKSQDLDDVIELHGTARVILHFPTCLDYVEGLKGCRGRSGEQAAILPDGVYGSGVHIRRREILSPPGELSAHPYEVSVNPSEGEWNYWGYFGSVALLIQRKDDKGHKTWGMLLHLELAPGTLHK